MNRRINQPRQGRHIRKISLLTELRMFRLRISTTMSRLWRWESGTETQRLESLYQQKQAALAALKKSLLHQAFSGAL